MKKIKNAEVLVDEVNYVDKKSGEKKSFKVYKINVNGIKLKVNLSREAQELLEQIPYSVEEIKEN